MQLHEGVVVEEACRKFTMRSEVMYSGHHIGRIMNAGSPPRGNNRIIGDHTATLSVTRKLCLFKRILPYTVEQ